MKVFQLGFLNKKVFQELPVLSMWKMKALLEQITKQLNKQIDVLKVTDITDQSIVSRELALIKVPPPQHTRNEIYSLIEPFRATVVDVSKESLVIQITGESEKIEAFIELIKPYGIKELARTGTTAFPRGMQLQSNSPKDFHCIILTIK